MRFYYVNCIYSTSDDNPLMPSDKCMSQWTRTSLVQIMSCRLFNTRPSSESFLFYHLIKPFGTNYQVTTIVIQEDEFEIFVCKMSAILSRPHCGNLCFPISLYLYQSARFHRVPCVASVRQSHLNNSCVIYQLLSNPIFDIKLQIAKHNTFVLYMWII